MHCNFKAVRQWFWALITSPVTHQPTHSTILAEQSLSIHNAPVAVARWSRSAKLTYVGPG